MRGCEVAADDLEPAHGRALDHYLRTASSQPSDTGPTVHDAVVFELTIEDEGGSRHVAFSELSLPEELEDLVAWLQRHSRPVRL